MANINKLKRLRGAAGLSLRELAAKAGVNQTTISLIETDKRKGQIATLGKLAKALDVPIDELLEFMDTTASDRGRYGQEVKQAKAEHSGELRATAATQAA